MNHTKKKKKKNTHLKFIPSRFLFLHSFRSARGRERERERANCKIHHAVLWSDCCCFTPGRSFSHLDIKPNRKLMPTRATTNVNATFSLSMYVAKMPGNLVAGKTFRRSVAQILYTRCGSRSGAAAASLLISLLSNPDWAAGMKNATPRI